MADALNFTARVIVQGTYVKDRTVSDETLGISLDDLMSFANGTGASQCDLWYGIRTASNLALDLDALTGTGSPFGDTINFAAIRMFYCKLHAMGGGSELLISNTFVYNTLIQNGTASQRFSLFEGDTLLRTFPVSGGAVSGVNLVNTTNSSTDEYTLLIAGVSA